MKSMVSVRLRGKDVVTRSSVTSSLVIGSRKLTKMVIEEVVIDLEYVGALEKALMITPANVERNVVGEEETKALGHLGGATVLANKGVRNHGEYFRSRLQELHLINI